MNGSSPAPGQAPLPAARGVPALLAAVPVAVAIDVVLPAVWGARAGWAFILSTVAYVAIWASVGWVACRLRPDRRMGRLMILFAILVAVNSVPGFGIPDHGLVTDVGGGLSLAVAPVQTPFFGHILLAFPSGHLARVGERRLIRIAYGYAAVEIVTWLLAFRPHSPSCGARCGSTPFTVIDDPHVRAILLGSVTLGWLPLVAWFAVLVVRRYRQAGRRERRVLAAPFFCAGAIVVLFAVLVVYAAAHRRVEYGTSQIAVELLRVASLPAVPLCFLTGLLRERLAYARVGDLVRDLGRRTRRGGPGHHRLAGHGARRPEPGRGISRREWSRRLPRPPAHAAARRSAHHHPGRRPRSPAGPAPPRPDA